MKKWIRKLVTGEITVHDSITMPTIPTIIDFGYNQSGSPVFRIKIEASSINLPANRNSNICSAVYIFSFPPLSLVVLRSLH